MEVLFPILPVQAVTDTDDTIKPALIILSALAPALIVFALVVNKPISLSGISRHIAVPAHIIINTIIVAVEYIFLTLLCSPAP